MPKTFLNQWVLTKIVDYLSIKEGCSVLSTEFTNTGARGIVQDALGFQYEVSIKTIGRLDPASTEDQDRFFTRSSKPLLEKMK